jgi:hypothetical protein
MRAQVRKPLFHQGGARCCLLGDAGHSQEPAMRGWQPRRQTSGDEHLRPPSTLMGSGGTYAHNDGLVF